jgi:uncharacterized protein
MIIQNLHKKKLIHPPEFLLTNTHYLTIMGSVAYGVSADTSDNDIYGFCIPRKEDIFPHLKGEIIGFGKQINRFEQWSEHHIQDVETEKNYDFAVYSIVKFFQLCMENNPNMVDALFTPINCVIHSTAIGNMVRENRKGFLHKGCWPKFKGYAYSQLHKMKIKTPEGGSKRAANIEQFGYDTKFAYHVYRLLDEVEQILTLHDCDLQRSREVMKSIRRGEWTEERIREHFTSREKELETVYNASTLPWGPDEAKIKKLLLECLEHHFGSLDKAIILPNANEQALREIMEVCKKALSNAEND